MSESYRLIIGAKPDYQGRGRNSGIEAVSVVLRSVVSFALLNHSFEYLGLLDVN